MFRDASVQAERGMMIDKDVRRAAVFSNQSNMISISYILRQVLDTYLVVKLSEAMFDMKEQLQMMEAQVASITKQKESLERTLQAKTQYVRVRAKYVHTSSKICCYPLPSNQNTIVSDFL